MQLSRSVVVVLGGAFLLCALGHCGPKNQVNGKQGKGGNKAAGGNDPRGGGGGGERGGSATGDEIKAGEPDKKPTPVDPPKLGQMDEVLQSIDRAIAQKSGRAHFRYGGYRSRRHAKNKQKDKTLAPYFQTPGSSEAGIESLPLKKTSADVRIAGVIAQAKVRQVYKNEGKKAIEAVYVFPASTRAAVHGMRMKIGDRIIEARIKERKQARKIYEQAKKAGKRASLLEQERPNVFTMNVANIMPGDVIEVELDYSELLVPEDQVYEFVYPTVVGPRFAGGADPKTDKWMANPHLKAGKKEPYAFDIKVHVESPIGIKALSSPSHKVDVKYASRTSAQVSLAKKGGGNRDYVLRYRLAGDKIESGVLVYKGKKENFFLMMMEPPARVKKKQIPPREYIFLVDVSGSMFGFPLNTSKQLIRDLFKGLRRTDYFNVVLFAGASRTLSPKSLRATEGNLNKVLNVINRQRGGGSTQLMAGLKTAYGLPKVKNQGVSRNIVVITDGYVGVEAKTFRYISKHLNKANVFAFGIGSSVNRGLIEGMARAGMGEDFVVLSPAEADSKAERFRKYIQSPVLTDINVAYKGISTFDVVPKQFPDLLAQRPLVAFGKFSGQPRGAVEVTGRSGAGPFRAKLAITDAQHGAQNAPLRVLWARKWVEKLMDQYKVVPKNAEIKKAVTNIGLTYKMLTRFTSFVAVGLKQVRKSGKVVTVRQPLPMPKGVSNKAIGGRRQLGLRRNLRRSMPRGRMRRSPSMSANPLSGLGGSSSDDRAAAPRPAKAEEKEIKRKKRVQVKIRSLRNVKSVKQAFFRALARRRISLASCVQTAVGTQAVTGKVTIKGGRVRISGVSNRQLAACLKKVFARIAARLRALNAIDDSAKPVIYRFRIKT